MQQLVENFLQSQPDKVAQQAGTTSGIAGSDTLLAELDEQRAQLGLPARPRVETSGSAPRLRVPAWLEPAMDTVRRREREHIGDRHVEEVCRVRSCRHWSANHIG